MTTSQPKSLDSADAMASLCRAYIRGGVTPGLPALMVAQAGPVVDALMQERSVFGILRTIATRGARVSIDIYQVLLPCRLGHFSP
jgi:hypothetical protein